MDVLTRFGVGDTEYIFDPDHQVNLIDNFRDAVPRTIRLPGVSGGFDGFGAGVAPLAVGNVQMTFWIYANSTAEMTTKLKALGAMVGWGVQPLYKIFMDGSEEVFCYARANSIPYNQRAGQFPHERMQLTQSFQVSSPGWLAQGTEAALWGSFIWGDGTLWGGSATPVAVNGLSNNFSIAPGGNIFLSPRITFSCGVGQTASNLKIQRLIGGQVKDEVSFTTTLIAGDSLEINTRSKSVTLNGADAYGSAFDRLRSEWFQLRGGLQNDIRVLMGNGGDAGSITFRYYEVYV